MNRVFRASCFVLSYIASLAVRNPFKKSDIHVEGLKDERTKKKTILTIRWVAKGES